MLTSIENFVSTYPQVSFLPNHRRVEHPLDIIIVGCGIGGLAASYTLGRSGHRVTILEKSATIGEVGAGIQVAPNLSRLLIRWGLADRLKECAVTPRAVSFRRYKDGERIGWAPLGDKFEKEYGSPYYHVHRADLYNMLWDIAKPFVNLRTNSKVVAIDPRTPKVTLESGEIIYADLIVGADGVRSVVRDVVVGRRDSPTPTGDAAYRAILPTSAMLEDPDLQSLVQDTEMTAWLGPGRHIMAYNIRAKKEYNIVMLHPDDAESESWTTPASIEQMREQYAGWEPTVQKLLSLIPSSFNWKLQDRSPLENWIHENGKVVLLGDACHPMLPYRAQGAAMAVEDAAVLGGLLSRLTHRKDLPSLLKTYQDLRYSRATETQLASRTNQGEYHVDDGPEQEARDAAMKAAMHVALKESEERSDGAGSNNPNMWADKTRNDRQYGYDADAEVQKWWMQEMMSAPKL